MGKKNKKWQGDKVVIEEPTQEEKDIEGAKEIKSLFDKILFVFMGYSNLEEMVLVKGGMEWYEFYGKTEFPRQVKDVHKWTEAIENVVNNLEDFDIGYFWQSLYDALQNDGEYLFCLWCTNEEFRDAVYDFHKLLISKV